MTEPGGERRAWHDLDLASLVMGAALLAVATGVLVADRAGDTVELRWVLPLVLLGVGAAGLLGSAVRIRRRPRVGEPDTARDPELDDSA